MSRLVYPELVEWNDDQEAESLVTVYMSIPGAKGTVNVWAAGLKIQGLLTCWCRIWRGGYGEDWPLPDSAGSWQKAMVTMTLSQYSEDGNMGKD